MRETTEELVFHKGKLAYRVKEFCAAFSIGNTTFWKWVKEGKIEVRKMGGLTVVPAESVKRFLESLPSA